MDITNIIKDMYLLDFYERKTNTILPATSTDLISLCKKLGGDFFSLLPAYKRLNKKMGAILEKRYPLIYNLLSLEKDNLCICGICILDLITCFGSHNPKKFDVYIHSCDIYLANSIILRCLTLLGNNILITKDYIDIFVEECDFVVRISLKIYKNRGELLLDIGPSPEKHGWDLVMNYFSTINGVLSLVMNAHPIDIFPNTYKLSLYRFYHIKTFTHSNSINLSSVQNVTNCVEIYNSSTRNIIYNATYNKNDINLPNKNVMVNRCLTLDELNQLTSIHNSIPKVRIDPISCFGENYTTIVVGIDNNRYVAFANCKSKFNLTQDLFRLICDFWLKAEVLDISNKVLY